MCRALLAPLLVMLVICVAAETKAQPLQRALLETQERSVRCTCKSYGACRYTGYQILEKTDTAAKMTWEACCELCAKTPGCRKIGFGGRSVGTHQSRTCRLFKAKAKREPYTFPHPHSRIECGVLGR